MGNGRDDHSHERTPEMLRAGAIALSAFSYDYQTFEDGARDVYEAMEQARLRQQGMPPCDCIELVSCTTGDR
jgi:hypothetical protein